MITIEKARQLRRMIVKAAASLDDTDAVTVKEMYDEWAPDTDYAAGDRRRHADKLWKARQAHRSQAQYPPGPGTEALWEQIPEDPGQGTKDNPIPYNNNMALENGKYYIQDGVEYLCFRDTEIAVYAALKDLVGVYVQIAE